MTRRVWPFKPLSPILVGHQWLTDIFRAKAAEQRMALRDRPLRTLQYTYQLSDYEMNYAQVLLRANQGADAFYIPDWSQADRVGALSSGSLVSVPGVNAERRWYGDEAFVYESLQNNERVTIDIDSDGGVTIDTLTNNYSDARFMPLWTGDAPEGGEGARTGANRNELSVGFLLDSGSDFSRSTRTQYQGRDVVEDCPILVGGISVSYDQILSRFGADVSDPKYFRRRDVDEVQFQMRWLETSKTAQGDLLDWIASRYGRQKSFWASTFSKDLEPAAAISGTTVRVFNDVLARPFGYHIDITARDGTRYYRQVTAAAAGSLVDGRATVDLTIDGSVTLALADIARISYLHLVRFESDRAEYNYSAPNVLRLAMNCIEVPA